jgi:peroxiredoxin
MAISVGDVAPAVDLPAANGEGRVSTAEYRGRSAVLLALFRGLYCPFCRSQIARLGVMAERLRPIGVETIGVVATAAPRARLYFRFRQAPIPLGADPDLTTHRAYGVPNLPLTPELNDAINEASLAWARELGIPAQRHTAHDDVQRFDGYEPTADDHADFARHQAQAIGQFLIDRDGILRWMNVQTSAGDQLPDVTDILDAIRKTTTPLTRA